MRVEGSSTGVVAVALPDGPGQGQSRPRPPHADITTNSAVKMVVVFARSLAPPRTAFPLFGPRARSSKTRCSACGCPPIDRARRSRRSRPGSSTGSTPACCMPGRAAFASPFRPIGTACSSSIGSTTRSVLHNIVRAHLATFLATAEGAGGVPAFVERELRQLLGCGVWARGFSLRCVPMRSVSCRSPAKRARPCEPLA